MIEKLQHNLWSDRQGSAQLVDKINEIIEHVNSLDYDAQQVSEIMKDFTKTDE